MNFEKENEMMNSSLGLRWFRPLRGKRKGFVIQESLCVRWSVWGIKRCLEVMGWWLEVMRRLYEDEMKCLKMKNKMNFAWVFERKSERKQRNLETRNFVNELKCLDVFLALGNLWNKTIWWSKMAECWP